MCFYQATEAAPAAENSSQLPWLKGSDDSCDREYRNPSYVEELYIKNDV